MFVNEPSCFSRGLKLLTLRGGSVTAGSHRRTENTEKSFFPMDFLTGLRPLLFTYVLINGILITLQTKEGERLHFYLNFSLHLTRCVGEGAARDPHCWSWTLPPGNLLLFIVRLPDSHTVDKCIFSVIKKTKQTNNVTAFPCVFVLISRRWGVSGRCAQQARVCNSSRWNWTLWKFHFTNDFNLRKM